MAWCAAWRVDYHNVSSTMDINICIHSGVGRGSLSVGMLVWDFGMTMGGCGNWGGVLDLGCTGRSSSLVHVTHVMTQSPKGRRAGLSEIAWAAGYNATLSHHYHIPIIIDLSVQLECPGECINFLHSHIGNPCDPEFSLVPNRPSKIETSELRRALTMKKKCQQKITQYLFV